MNTIDTTSTEKETIDIIALGKAMEDMLDATPPKRSFKDRLKSVTTPVTSVASKVTSPVNEFVVEKMAIHESKKAYKHEVMIPEGLARIAARRASKQNKKGE